MGKLKGSSLLESLIAMGLLAILAFLLMTAATFTVRHIPGPHERLGSGYIKALYLRQRQVGSLSPVIEKDALRISYASQVLQEREEDRVMLVTARVFLGDDLDREYQFTVIEQY